MGPDVHHPANTHATYDGDPSTCGTERDFVIGRQITGVCTLGEGLARYDATGSMVEVHSVSLRLPSFSVLLPVPLYRTRHELRRVA